jgi:PAS domain S-box-containing protein
MEFFNDMLEVLTGYLPTDLDRGEVCRIDSLIHPDDRPAVVRTVREAVAHGTPFELEYRLRTKSGELCHVLERGRPVAGTDGKPLYVDGVIVDITARRRAETRFRRMSETLLALGPDFRENIERLTALAGESLGATCALYNRLRDRRLCTWGRWKAPPDLPEEDGAEGHICYDVIRSATDNVLFIPDLASTRYAVTDPNVRAYGLHTFVGHVVRCGGTPVGSLCVVFQQPFIPTEEDRRYLAILAAAVGREEDRREAEELRRQAEEKFRALVENAPDIIMRFDREGRHLYVSPAVTRIVPIRPADYVGKTHRELNFPDAQCRMWEEAIRSVFETRQPHESEFTFEDAGRRFVFHWRLVPEFGPRGVVVSVLSLARDITGHRTVEEALRESEARHRSIFENIQDVYYENGLDGTLLEVSPSVEQVSSHRRDELLGRSLYDLYLDPAERDRTIAAIREHGVVREREVVFKDRDGTPVPCAVTGRLLYDAAGRPEKVCGVMRPIVERKRAEEVLRRSEERLRSLIDASPIAIVTITEDGRVQDWNVAAERLFGYTRQEVLGHPPPVIPGGMEDEFKALLARVIREDVLDVQTRPVRLKDGTTVDVVVHSSRYSDASGKSVGMVGQFIPVPPR